MNNNNAKFNIKERKQQIFLTGSLHSDHSIVYAFVCEQELSHMDKNNGHPDLVCEHVCSLIKCHDRLHQRNIEKKANIRNRYNQVQHMYDVLLL